MQYFCHDLRALRAQFRPLARLQSLWPEDQYMMVLRGLADLGGRAVTARDGLRLAGSAMFMPALKMGGIAATPGLKSAVERAGIAPGAVLCLTNIFVDPAYRGRGVSVAMEARAAELARVAGFTHSVALLYASREILAWFERRPDKISAGIEDAAGDPVYFLPLV
ncbi:hypothetical protein KUV26_16880 [Leisingera daeponensis]|uniref:N-acetyltransferase domain-containing protein n=1 Tax=Leisingera daeponensis TaxID=405746 RepID=A0ABS7NIS8_9RHOB|nr:GNAT family N-acetyltransferase [Leisingera daeponensis]MBY6141113.1 hypothetical protein [Leisingera daeponensis]